MLAEKYRPKSVAGIKGHNLNESILWLQNWKPGSKYLLIYGDTGTGKTSFAYALAKDYNYEVVEMNSSLVRNKEQIGNIIGIASKQKSLFYSGKIILIDEVDNISGQQDRGGVQAIAKIISESSYPVILTANDPWDTKLSSIRKLCRMVEFKNPDYLTVFGVLKEICEKEGIIYNETALKGIARRSGGDIRGAINDLDVLKLDKNQTNDLDILGDREKTESVANALKLIFKSRKSENVLGVFEKADIPLDEAFLWIDENITNEYLGKELTSAYEAMSRADVFKGRIRRQQHWRFLVYINALLTAGVATAKSKKNSRIVEYKKTKRLLKIWIMNRKMASVKETAKDLGSLTHMSSKKVVRELMPFMQFLKKDSNLIREIEGVL
jgi:replication factor C large subunit